MRRPQVCKHRVCDPTPMTTSGPVLSGMGSFVTFASQLMSGISYGVFVRLSRRVSRLKRIHEFPFRAGRVN
jgi:hypothetical protein